MMIEEHAAEANESPAGVAVMASKLQANTLASSQQPLHVEVLNKNTSLSVSVSGGIVDKKKETSAKSSTSTSVSTSTSSDPAKKKKKKQATKKSDKKEKKQSKRPSKASEGTGDTKLELAQNNAAQAQDDTERTADETETGHEEDLLHVVSPPKVAAVAPKPPVVQAKTKKVASSVKPVKDPKQQTGEQPKKKRRSSVPRQPKKESSTDGEPKKRPSSKSKPVVLAAAVAGGGGEAAAATTVAAPKKGTRAESKTPANEVTSAVPIKQKSSRSLKEGKSKAKASESKAPAVPVIAAAAVPAKKTTSSAAKKGKGDKATKVVAPMTKKSSNRSIKETAPVGPTKKSSRRSLKGDAEKTAVSDPVPDELTAAVVAQKTARPAKPESHPDSASENVKISSRKSGTERSSSKKKKRQSSVSKNPKEDSAVAAPTEGVGSSKAVSKSSKSSKQSSDKDIARAAPVVVHTAAAVAVVATLPTDSVQASDLPGNGQSSKAVDDVLQKYTGFAPVPDTAQAKSPQRTGKDGVATSKKSFRRSTSDKKKEPQSSAMEAEVAAFLGVANGVAVGAVANSASPDARMTRNPSQRDYMVANGVSYDQPMWGTDTLGEQGGFDADNASVGSMDTGISTLTPVTFRDRESVASSITMTLGTKDRQRGSLLEPIGEALPPSEIQASPGKSKRLASSLTALGDIEQGSGPLKDGSQDKSMSQSFFGQRRVQCGILAILLLAGGAVAVALGLVLGGSKGASPSGDGMPSLSPSAAPTVFTFEFFKEEILPPYSQEAIEDLDSPQSEAFTWLETDVVANDAFLIDKRVQRFALASFFYASGGEEWTSNTGWLDLNEDECDWYFGEPGRPCNNDGQYSEIILEANNLVGTLPEELALLTELQTLQLENGFFSGTIPSRLGLLTDLQVLGLRNLGLEGSIPSELGRLTNLDLMLLSGNALTGAIPTEAGLLTRLTGFLVTRGSLVGSIPSELAECTNLDLFSVGSNSLTGNIPTKFGLLTALTGASFYENLLSGPIPTELGLLTDLEYLFLDINALTGTIPSELGNLENLIQLWLGSNLLGGTVPEEVCDLIANGTEVQVDCDSVQCDCGCLCS